FVRGKPKHEVLREALEHLDRDRSFDPGTGDDTFHNLDALVGTDIDLLIAGHTHLERSLPRSRGRGHYFNSGTWARLICIEPAVRQDPAAFERLFRLLDGGTLEMLGRARLSVRGRQRQILVPPNPVVVIAQQ